MKDKHWPAWYSSPDGSQTDIFHAAEEVPDGWTTGAEKAKVEKAAKAVKGKKPADDDQQVIDL